VSDRKTFAIVGGGLAGAKAAETLREEGFDGRIVLVADEAHLPYERPPLSKTYLAGDSKLAEAHVHDEGFYSDKRIELLTSTRATALDTSAHRVSLSDGEELRYDRLLIATGAAPRRPPIEGASSDSVHVLRSVADADGLRAALCPGARLVVIGAGWIDSEAAATARGLGAEVTVIEQATVPLERVLGARIGQFFADLHRDQGVELLTNAGVQRIEGAVRRVRLADGRTIDADAVLFAIGVAPATALAEAGGSLSRRGSSSMSTCALATPTCSRPATSPRLCTRATGGESASSTGTTLCPRVPRPPARCSATPTRT
jgi:3-phenylpropionate/trans-cinnamate dioxygenase ferredoxin reductase subunit